MLLLPWWYIRVVPRDYIDTLSVVEQPVEDAYQTFIRLHRLPGFGSTADRLFTDILRFHSERSNDYAEVREVDEHLRAIPDREALAEELLGDYWLRRAHEASRREDRDEALLFAAAAIPGQGAPARLLASELIGEDYGFLQRSFHLGESPDYWEVDWGGAGARRRRAGQERAPGYLSSNPAPRPFRTG